MCVCSRLGWLGGAGGERSENGSEGEGEYPGVCAQEKRVLCCYCDKRTVKRDIATSGLFGFLVVESFLFNLLCRRVNILNHTA
jgi:hypothetical protein